MLPQGILKEYSRTISYGLRSLDVIAMIISGFIAYLYKFQDSHLPDHYLIALLIGAFCTAIVFPFFLVYDSMRGQSFFTTIKKLIQSILTVLVLLSGLAFFTKTGDDFSREWFFLWAAVTLLFSISLRCALLMTLRIMRSKGWNERRVVVVGAGDLGVRLVNQMQQALWTGFRIVALYDDHPEQKSNVSVPVKKTPAHWTDIVNDIDEVWIAMPLQAEARVKDILHELRHHTVTTRLVLDIFGMDLLNHSVTELAGFPMLNICSTPMMGVNRFKKALEDRLLAFLILILISPLLLVIAFAVKCSSPGPIFYRQKRVSWNGKEFDMLKFRTMPVDAEAKSGPVWAKAGEDRATKVGRFLRKTSLDELPQFLNVLCGDMSIVGPRPERPHFVEQFKEQIPRYMQKHMVKAGITGWAQVNGWRGDTRLDKRIEYDLYYIEHWSVGFDLKIIFLTLLRGFINKNAY